MKPVNYLDLDPNHYYMSYVSQSIGKRTMYFKLAEPVPQPDLFTIVEAVTVHRQGDNVNDKKLDREDNYTSVVCCDEQFYELDDDEVNLYILSSII